MFGRLVRRAAAASVLALVSAGTGPGFPPVSAAGPDEAPGAVVEVTALPPSSWIPGAASGERVTYWSTGPTGRPALSTGAVFLPPGPPPPGGWPVISWAHGTVGVADQCAPTVTGRIGGPYLGHWISEGYAVVATDYVGLGTPGTHAYLDGTSAARNVVDMVRAARRSESDLAAKWVALGQSQGGQAALVTAAIATEYAPDLDFRGAVATGAPSNLEHLAPLVRPEFPDLPLVGSSVFVAFILTGLRAYRPDLDIDSYLTPRGREIVDRAETECYEALADSYGDVGIGELVDRPLDDPQLLTAIADMLRVPTTGYDRPFFVGHGLTDEIVPVPLAAKLATELTANTQPATVAFYPTGHLETMRAALPDTTRFVRALITR